MNKVLIVFLTLLTVVFVALSCAADIKKETGATIAAESGVVVPGMPAVPGSDAAGDPSADLPVEITGIVKEIKDTLVLVEIPDKGSDYMLRFSEISEWGTGINTEISVGSRVVCVVRPEPVLTEPSQGEVLRIVNNVSPE